MSVKIATEISPKEVTGAFNAILGSEATVMFDSGDIFEQFQRNLAADAIDIYRLRDGGFEIQVTVDREHSETYDWDASGNYTGGRGFYCELSFPDPDDNSESYKVSRAEGESYLRIAVAEAEARTATMLTEARLPKQGDKE